MEISEAIDRGVKARWRHDLINMLTDAGRTLAGTGLRANGSVYRDINIGMLLLEAARSLQECQDEAEPEKDATEPMTNSGGQTMAEYIDRVEYCEKHCRCNNDYCNRQSCPIWEAPAADVAPVVRGRGSGKPMVEPVQPLTAQDAPKPMTNGDRIRAMTDEELAESDELLSGLCNVLHGQGYPCEANTCRECLIKWLGSPEKEANDGQ